MGRNAVNGRERPTWERYALIVAAAVAIRSEDPYVQVGAVVLREDHSVASVGYNGPPSGMDLDWSDRDFRRPRIVHAEANALRYVKPGEGVLLASTMMPCVECLKLTASYGIKDIVYTIAYENLAVYDGKLAVTLAEEFGVSLRQVH